LIFGDFGERLHLVAFFYFVLIFGFEGGFEIAALSLAMTGFLGLHVVTDYLSFLLFGYDIVFHPSPVGFSTREDRVYFF